MSKPRIYHVDYVEPSRPNCVVTMRIVADNPMTRKQMTAHAIDRGASSDLKISKVRISVLP